MIITGLNAVFNGKVNLEFRRKIRMIHKHMGLTEAEFNTFVSLFEDTINEFQIEDDDKKMVMSQLRSTKSLICRLI